MIPAGRWVQTRGIGAYYIVERGRARRRLGVIWEGVGGRWWSGLPGTTNLEHPTELQAMRHVEESTRKDAESFFRENA